MNYEDLLKIFLHLKTHPEDIAYAGVDEVGYIVDEQVIGIKIACTGTCVTVSLPNFNTIDVDTSAEEIAEVKYYMERLTEVSNEYWINRMLCTVSL